MFHDFFSLAGDDSMFLCEQYSFVEQFRSISQLSQIVKICGFQIC